jgi:heterodisulfide reductase subunit C/nitrate reductase gamma subunit
MSSAVFTFALAASLAVCALGVAWRVSTWFRVRIGPDARSVSSGARVLAALRGAAATLASRRVAGVARALVLDVALQRRLFAREKLRWAGHLLLVTGFTLLLVLHALAPVVTAKLFRDYQSTASPYLFLRDLFGAMVVAGIALVLAGRRRRKAVPPPRRRTVDRVFVALLGVVLLSGFALTGAKMASPRAFDRMADEYYGTTDPAETLPLRTFWAAEFGASFDDVTGTPDPDVLAEGRRQHAETCAECHAPAKSAFVSYGVARALSPVAGPLDRAHADSWLLYVHVFACLLGLATLPFTRFFHALADPVSLAVNGAAPAAGLSAAGRANRRALALDACVQCGVCDTRCSVAAIARHLDNPALLPSRKLLEARAIGAGALARGGDAATVERVAEGAFLCTTCGRCTARCPVGLDLEDLWDATRADLAVAGHPAPPAWIQASPAFDWAELLSPGPGVDAEAAPLSADRRTFSPCVQCQTCTNVCPVVAHSVDADGVDLTPQKVMNLLRLGMVDLALGSRMVWDCATCYQCQEHCPEGIRVTDVIFELRGLAVRRLATVRDRRQPA